MTNKKDYKVIGLDAEKITNVVFDTTAERAYEMYLAKKKQIYDLEYECGLLVEKYHDEMSRASIPSEFLEHSLALLFAKDKTKDFIDAARNFFLERGFSQYFLKSHKSKIHFVSSYFNGYHSTAIGIVLEINKYHYHIEFPQPRNITSPEDRKLLMGEVKFRVDRIHESKSNDFCKTMESVMLPTYDWKECFKAIEAIVAKNAAVCKDTGEE